MWYSDQNLTAGAIVDTVVTGMNGPDRFASPVRKALRESRLDFGRNLIDESLCRGNIDEHAIVTLFENLLHCIESNKGMISFR